MKVHLLVSIFVPLLLACGWGVYQDLRDRWRRKP
jgi:hypothetical protein